MQDLVAMIREVPDCYAVFAIAVTRYAEKTAENLEAVKEYLRTHPAAMASDILGFIFQRDLVLE